MSHFDADLNIIVEKLTTSQSDADYEKLGAEKTYKKFKTSYQQGMPRGPVNSDLSLKKPAQFFLKSYLLGAQSRVDQISEQWLVAANEYLAMTPILQVPSCLEGYSDIFRVWMVYNRKICGDNLSELLPRLQGFIENLQAGNSQLLTVAHCELLHIIWEVRAWGFWDHTADLCELPKSGLRIVEFLRYYYYAGCIHLLHKRYSQAIQSLSIVLFSPKESGSVSAIQIDAMKRYKLACLIHFGKPLEPPNTKSGLRRANGQSISLPEYDEIEQAFEQSIKGSIDIFDTAMAKHMDALANDLNYGLCKRVRQAIFKQRVLILKKVYLAIPLQKITELVFTENTNPADQTLAMLKEMRNNKEISFKVEETKELSLEEQAQSQIIRFDKHIDLAEKAELVLRKVNQLSSSMVRISRENELTAPNAPVFN